MIGKHRILTTLVSAAAVLAFSGASLAAKPEAKPGHQASDTKVHQKKAHHQNGKQLLGEKIKSNGHHVLEQKGDVTASVDVRDGKITGLHAKHAKKGDLPVKKYKTTQKMAQADAVQGVAHLVNVQYEYVGSTYIGYSYYDDYGYEQIYWFPVDMIYDGDTGAIEYVPTYY
jgi:hypothetical protein